MGAINVLPKRENALWRVLAEDRRVRERQARRGHKKGEAVEPLPSDVKVVNADEQSLLLCLFEVSIETLLVGFPFFDRCVIAAKPAHVRRRYELAIGSQECVGLKSRHPIGISFLRAVAFEEVLVVVEALEILRLFALSEALVFDVDFPEADGVLPRRRVRREVAVVAERVITVFPRPFSTHVQEQRGNTVRLDILGAEVLIVVWFEHHRGITSFMLCGIHLASRFL